MIHYVEINSKKYPFVFGMREVWMLSSGQGIEFDDALQAVHLDFGLFLRLFESASKKGARRHAEENGGDVGALSLTKEQIEDFVDDEPALFEDLQRVFNESKAFKNLEDRVEKKHKALMERITNNKS